MNEYSSISGWVKSARWRSPSLPGCPAAPILDRSLSFTLLMALRASGTCSQAQALNLPSPVSADGGLRNASSSRFGSGWCRNAPQKQFTVTVPAEQFKVKPIEPGAFFRHRGGLCRVRRMMQHAPDIFFRKGLVLPGIHQHLVPHLIDGSAEHRDAVQNGAHYEKSLQFQPTPVVFAFRNSCKGEFYIIRTENGINL